MPGGVIEMLRIAAHATPHKKSCYYIHEQNELTGTDDTTVTDSILMWKYDVNTAFNGGCARHNYFNGQTQPHTEPTDLCRMLYCLAA